MPEISNQNSTGYLNSQNNSNVNSFGYDLQEEKKRIALGTEEIKQEILEKLKKKYANAEIFPASVAAMHPDVVNFLLGFNLVSVYDNIAKQAGLDAKSRNILPHIVWQVAQTKNWSGIDRILESQLPLVHSVHMQVAQLLTQNILSKIRVLSEKPFVKKDTIATEMKKEIQLPIAEAIKNYPSLGEQDIANNPLKLKYFPNSVRPSVKNWITDFHDNMGAGKHGAVDRGNYLFHSENGKKLTPMERQKLSAILKSLDENSPLTIDPVAQKIIFREINIQQPIISNQSSEIRRYGNDEEQKDIFQKNERIKPTAQAPSLIKKNEDLKLKYAPAMEDNYFKIPKYQPKTNLEPNPEPKVDTRVQENKMPFASHNYSPNFKDITENHFSSEQKRENTNHKKSAEPVAAEGKLSFSSPQKLPAEQDVKVAEKKNISANQQKSPSPSPAQVDKIVQTQKKTTFPSQWEIRPSTYFDEKESDDRQSSQPKIKGNVVDLKN